MGRSRRFFKCRCWCPSPPPEVGPSDNISHKPQSLAVPGPALPLPNPQTSAIQAQKPTVSDLIPPAAGDHVTSGGSVTPLSSDDHGSPSFSNVIAGGSVTAVPLGDDHGSPSDVPGSPLAPVSTPITPYSQPEPITSENTAPSDVLVLPQTKSTPGPDVTEPSSPSSAVWDKALIIARTKLDKIPLDITDLTSKSATANMDAVIEAVVTLQKDEKNKRWGYKWGEKKVIIVDQLGKFINGVQNYSNIVGVAMQSHPVSGFVWAGVQAIMQVRI